MDLISVVAPLLIGSLVGYLLGSWRDRFSAIRSKKTEAITRLHERVLQIERMELSDGKMRTLSIPMEGGRRKPKLLDDDELDYQNHLNRWRDRLHKEEDRAGLWLDRLTIRLVSNYFLLMMQCSRWENFGKGNLADDPDFKRRLGTIFGRNTKVWNQAVRYHGQTGEPWLLDCDFLSALCLEAIQRRIHFELKWPIPFRLMSFWWRWQEKRERKRHRSTTS